jgi:hypothetical protein
VTVRLWEFKSPRGHINGAGSFILDNVATCPFYAGLAHLAEQLTCNEQATGSSPVTGSEEKRRKK